MILISLEPAGRGKLRVDIEGKPAFFLYKGEADRLGLVPDMEISEGLYTVIMQDILLKRAKLRCLNILRTADKTEQQLRTKLLQGGYPQDVIDQAIAYVKEYGYVDDRRYARIFLEGHSRTHSIREIKQKLLQKGISREDIEEAFAGACMDGEEQAIRRLAEKRHMIPGQIPQEELQKHYAFFMRKGFSYRAIRKVLLGGEEEL